MEIQRFRRRNLRFLSFFRKRLAGSTSTAGQILGSKVGNLRWNHDRLASMVKYGLCNRLLSGLVLFVSSASALSAQTSQPVTPVAPPVVKEPTHADLLLG